MCGKIRHNKIRNDNIKENVGISLIIDKMVENRLWLFGHVEKIF